MIDRKIIDEGNKSLALYMGGTTDSFMELETVSFTPETYPPYPYGEKEIAIHSMKFHRSWDWLMPVIEKIEIAKYAVEIKGNSCIITDNGNSVVDRCWGKTKIESTWLCTVEFLKKIGRKTS